PSQQPSPPNSERLLKPTCSLLIRGEEPLPDPRIKPSPVRRMKVPFWRNRVRLLWVTKAALQRPFASFALHSVRSTQAPPNGQLAPCFSDAAPTGLGSATQAGRLDASRPALVGFPP